MLNKIIWLTAVSLITVSVSAQEVSEEQSAIETQEITPLDTCVAQNLISFTRGRVMNAVIVEAGEDPSFQRLSQEEQENKILGYTNYLVNEYITPYVELVGDNAVVVTDEDILDVLVTYCQGMLDFINERSTRVVATDVVNTQVNGNINDILADKRDAIQQSILVELRKIEDLEAEIAAIKGDISKELNEISTIDEFLASNTGSSVGETTEVVELTDNERRALVEEYNSLPEIKKSINDTLPILSEKINEAQEAFIKKATEEAENSGEQSQASEQDNTDEEISQLPLTEQLEIKAGLKEEESKVEVPNEKVVDLKGDADSLNTSEEVTDAVKKKTPTSTDKDV